jgi:hypothetical protein
MPARTVSETKSAGSHLSALVMLLSKLAGARKLFWNAGGVTCREFILAAATKTTARTPQAAATPRLAESTCREPAGTASVVNAILGTSCRLAADFSTRSCAVCMAVCMVRAVHVRRAVRETRHSRNTRVNFQQRLEGLSGTIVLTWVLSCLSCCILGREEIM